jgi:tetratricopeptide (TPR) repeat protein
MTGVLLKLRFYGPFRATDAAGNDVTPKSRKGKGVLAVLGTSEDMLRTRRWLQDILWSDRTPEQAGGSLRQTLTELRKCLAPCGDVLDADRNAIWLNPELVETDLDDPAPQTQTFLEGLDVRDPKFTDWRQAQCRTPLHLPLPSGQPGVRFRCLGDGSNGGVIGSIVADQLGHSLEEHVSSWVVDRQGDVEVKCDLAELGPSNVLTVRVTHEHTGTLLYSGFREYQGNPSQALVAGFLAELVHETVGRVVTKLPQVLGLDRPEVVAAGFANIALNRLGSFETEKLVEADALFQRAYAADGNGLYLAWRAFVRMAQVVDQDKAIAPELLEEVEGLLSKALEASPYNSVALSLVSLTRNMLFDDHGTALELAKMATHVNTNGLLAKQSLAVATSTDDDPLSAYEASRICQSALGADGLRHLWDLYHALVCIRSGKLDEATESAKRAANASAFFVAPRRQLLSLYLAAGEEDAAMQILQELKNIDPTFSLDRYFNDEDYPVMTLRKAGLLKRASLILEQ